MSCMRCRPFCEALRSTHVAHVSGGRVAIEERSLRESDWAKADNSGQERQVSTINYA